MKIVVVLLICLLPVMTSAAPLAPKMVLQITVDGLRGDLLNRYRANFGKGGFRYLLDMARKVKYPDEGPATAMPYAGIENLRPESKAAVEAFLFMQKTLGM